VNLQRHMTSEKHRHSEFCNFCCSVENPSLVEINENVDCMPILVIRLQALYIMRAVGVPLTHTKVSRYVELNVSAAQPVFCLSYINYFAEAKFVNRVGFVRKLVQAECFSAGCFGADDRHLGDARVDELTTCSKYPDHRQYHHQSPHRETDVRRR
jgi:hypothetical protein